LRSTMASSSTISYGSLGLLFLLTAGMSC
jgi:hypothetical protein